MGNDNEMLERAAKEMDQILGRCDAIMTMAPDQWAKVEALYDRLIKMDTIFGTIVKFSKNMKGLAIFFDQLEKDFPDVEEIMKLHARCEKYLYGVSNKKTN